jgi:hypothetical protein
LNDVRVISVTLKIHGIITGGKIVEDINKCSRKKIPLGTRYYSLMMREIIKKHAK